MHNNNINKTLSEKYLQLMDTECGHQLHAPRTNIEQQPNRRIITTCLIERGRAIRLDFGTDLPRHSNIMMILSGVFIIHTNVVCISRTLRMGNKNSQHRRRLKTMQPTIDQIQADCYSGYKRYILLSCVFFFCFDE